MRILIHTDEYLPRHVPIAIRMHVFYQVFHAKGNQVKVLAGNHSLDGGNKKAGEAIYCVTVPLKKKTSINRMVNQVSFGMSSLICSFAAGKADVVFTSSPPILTGIFAWMMARLKRAILIYDVRDIWPDVALEMGIFSEKSLYCMIFRRIAMFMYRHADIITTVSPGKKKKIQEKLPPGQKEKVWLVENGLDESFLYQKEDPEAIEKYGLDKKRTIVYFGNIGLAQGLENLIKLAVELDPNVYQVLFFGDGIERKKLEAEVKRNNLEHVFFCGRVEENIVYTVLKHSFVAYIPLVNAKLRDSIPTKTYEALGAGCPALLVAEGDATELIKETGFGITLSPSHISELSKTFQVFCSQYEEIMTKKEAAKSIILKKHSRQKIADYFEYRMKEFAGGRR